MSDPESLSVVPTSFPYKPLDPARSEIRLVCIAPASHDAPIVCNLIQTSLKDDCHYLALSYVWGDPSRVLPIQVDGHTFNVTENLEAALRHLRLISTARSFWIDAICINQRNIAERNQQVELMGAIYKSAVQVQVWLGLETDSGTRILEAADRLGQKIIEVGLDQLLVKQPDRETTERLIAIIAAEFRQQYTNGVWLEELKGIFDRPWWSRVWVQQEFALAKSAYFVCGQTSVHWRFLDMVMIALHYLDSDTTFAYSSHDDKRNIRDDQGNIISLRFQHENGWPMSLFNLVFQHGKLRDLKATDPRDHIFGFLGLADKAHGFRPDYSMPVDVLTCRFAKAHICHVEERRRRLWVLSFAQKKNLKDTDGLPSWAPDWSSPLDPHIVPSLFGTLQIYFPCGREIPPELPTFSKKEPKILPVTGTCFGTVEQFGASERLTFSKFLRSSELDVLMRSCGNLLEEAQNYVKVTRPTSQTGESAPVDDSKLLWRTLVLDRNLIFSTPEQRANSETFRRFLVLSKGSKHLPDDYMPRSDEQTRRIKYTTPLLKAMKKTLHHRQMFRSSAGHLCIGPETVEPGDKLCILIGAEVPFILRSHRDHHVLVGEAYVDGAMDGEVLTQGFTSKVFDLH
ncbi:hypothetical protein MMC07_004222 [Pseudocyphellaria aurata]|nr:hypothetical protein [Pseudocyphellaria aurata]